MPVNPVSQIKGLGGEGICHRDGPSVVDVADGQSKRAISAAVIPSVATMMHQFAAFPK